MCRWGKNPLSAPIIEALIKRFILVGEMKSNGEQRRTRGRAPNLGVRSASGCSRNGSAISDRSHAVPLQISSLPCDDSVAGRVFASPQTHPLDTAPIPANVRILEEPCSPLGAMMCGAVSILSGETAVERRSACIVYVEPNGKRVEQCGSLPLSQP